MGELLDCNQELPSYFDNELHKWSLECKYFKLFLKFLIMIVLSGKQKTKRLVSNSTLPMEVSYNQGGTFDISLLNLSPQNVSLTVLIVAGIGQIALDVRLGCLNENLSSDSEPQKLIDGAKYALRNIALLELKFPFWRYLPSNLWRNYIKNMDYFVE